MFLAAILGITQQNIDFYLLGLLGQVILYCGFGLQPYIQCWSIIIGTIQTVISPYISEKQEDLSWVEDKPLNSR